MSDQQRHTGRCLCGAVRFEAEGAPLWVGHCHCASCRRHTASALATFVGVAAERFRWSAGEPGGYASSPGVTRRFCRDCGTPLTYESARWPGEVHILIGAMDASEAFVPQFHVFTAEKLPWLELADGLPRHSGPSGG